MKKLSLIILLSITYLFFSCGNEEKKQPKKEIQSMNKLKPAAVKINPKISSKNITAPKEIKSKKRIDKREIFAVKNDLEIKTPIQHTAPKTVNPSNVKKEVNDKLMSFVNLRKILEKCKMGQTMTQKQLTENFEIPEEAVKLVKSVTKTAENELAVKWQSTWFVEKVSDAELEDGKMKVVFKANKMYTSGNAIGIKYNRKVYNNLVIIGRSAYIPSVKGYSWQIGR
ncbi:hypothetical protein OD917_14865 [Flavobacterium sp. SH_e]|uniref:hypothetical protein n=1 Tax=Flavobacterium sp. SH_e TaxID=2983767 RepID=UPI0021E51453|nr:hypothetical protein [Flavobacterium sp. SH_e]MCV2486216.1 hypothetical protein [Flavobacterium sp. SH_e]